MANVEFFEATEGGRVHVYSHHRSADPKNPAAGMMARLVALCGVAGECAERGWMTEFEDGRLCMKCHALYGGDKNELFEHPCPPTSTDQLGGGE